MFCFLWNRKQNEKGAVYFLLYKFSSQNKETIIDSVVVYKTETLTSKKRVDSTHRWAGKKLKCEMFLNHVTTSKHIKENNHYRLMSNWKVAGTVKYKYKFKTLTNITYSYRILLRYISTFYQLTVSFDPPLLLLNTPHASFAQLLEHWLPPKYKFRRPKCCAKARMSWDPPRKLLRSSFCMEKPWDLHLSFRVERNSETGGGVSDTCAL